MGRSTSHIPSAPRKRAENDIRLCALILVGAVPRPVRACRSVLCRKSWIEMGDAAISDLMDGPVADNPVPFMGPPVLMDGKAGAAIAQMPAILYLGETLRLLPATAALRALSMKIVNDANDVIDEVTLRSRPRNVDARAMGGFRPSPEDMDVVLGKDRLPPRSESGFRLPAWRRCARRCRHRNGHLMVKPGPSSRYHRGDPEGDRAHDDGSYPKDRGNAANGQARRKRPAKNTATSIAVARSKPPCARRSPPERPSRS